MTASNESEGEAPGVNFDDFMAGGWMGAVKPLTGRGRSGFYSLTVRF